MKKGITLIELLLVLTIIMFICWLFLLIIGGGKDMECYYTTKGIICTYDKIGSNKE